MRPLLQNLLAADNAARKSAEAQLEHLVSNSYRDALAAMLELTGLQNEEESLMASILLKSKFIDNAQSPNLTNDDYSALLARLRLNFMPQRKLAYLKKNAESIVAILARLSRSEQIFGLVQELTAVPHCSSQLLAMYIIEISCEYAFTDATVTKHSKLLEQMLTHGLAHPDLDVQMAAFQSLTGLVRSIDHKKNVKMFVQALPTMLGKLIEVVQKDQHLAQTALANFITLVEKQPNFIKGSLTEVLVLFTELIDNTSNNICSSLRIAGMEGLRVLAHSFSDRLKEDEVFIKRTLPMYVKVIAENERTPLEEWASDISNVQLQKNDVSTAAVENLVQLVDSLSVEYLLPKFIGLITECIQSDKTSFQHSGLSIMSVLSEMSAASFKSDMSNIFKMVYRLASTPNPRVLYDVVFALAELCSEFSPDLQTNHGRDILLLIVTTLNHPLEKLRLCALQSISNYCTNIKEQPAALAPLLENLGQLMQLVSAIFDVAVKNDSFYIIEECIACLGGVADQCGSHFSSYYEYFMPGLRKYFGLLHQKNAKEQALRTKLVQCMGHMLASIKESDPAALLRDSREIMLGLLKMLEAVEKDDTFRVGFFSFVENLTICLREKFEEFLPAVFLHVNNGVNLQIECKLVDAALSPAPVNDPNGIKKYTESQIDLKMFGGMKKFILNYSALQVKIEASKLFVSLGEYLGLLMEQYIPACIETICQNMGYDKCWDIRYNMLQAVRYLIEDCGNEKQKQFFAKVIWEQLARRIQKSVKVQASEEISQTMETISCICKYFNPDIIAAMPLMLISVVQTVNKIVDTRDREHKEDDDDDDEDDGEVSSDPEQAYEHVERTVDTMMRLGHSHFAEVLKYFPKDYESVLNTPLES